MLLRCSLYSLHLVVSSFTRLDILQHFSPYEPSPLFPQRSRSSPMAVVVCTMKYTRLYTSPSSIVQTVIGNMEIHAQKPDSLLSSPITHICPNRLAELHVGVGHPQARGAGTGARSEVRV
ncbi:uncharacterized protein HD556DRAFT_1412956, partial [Suillus plorans]